MSDPWRTEAMRRNAAVFDLLAADCAKTGRKVTVALSSNEVPKPGGPEQPAKDLVIRVTTALAGRDPVTLSEPVTRSLREAVWQLRRKLALA